MANWDVREVADDVRAPVPVSNDSQSNHLALLCATSRASSALSRTSPRILAGTPATMANGGTSFVTTAPAPTSAPRPMVTPATMDTLTPDEDHDSTTMRN